MDLEQAVRAVLQECPNQYAKSYAQAFHDNRAQGTATGMSQAEADAVQVAYILSNLSSWRGERAREVRAVLKAAAR